MDDGDFLAVVVAIAQNLAAGDEGWRLATISTANSPERARSQNRCRLNRARIACSFTRWTREEEAMSTSLKSETQARVGRYLTGLDPLAKLQTWIREHALTVVEDEGDLDDAHVVYGVELVLAEREHGDWDDDEVQARPRELLPAVPTPL
ncbi:MAG: hypothetical protein ACYDCQ_06580 [Dehalococcoidia bacterium]